MSILMRNIRGDPQLAGLAQAIAANPEVQRKRQVGRVLHWKVSTHNNVLVCQSSRQQVMLHCRFCTFDT